MKLPHSHGVQWELSRFIFGFALSRVSGRMTLAVSFKSLSLPKFFHFAEDQITSSAFLTGGAGDIVKPGA